MLCKARAHSRGELGRAVVRVFVPAGVVGLGDRVDFRVDRARTRRRVPAPDVDRDHPAGVVGVQPARRVAHVAHLGGVAAIAGDLVDEVPREDRRVERGGSRGRAHLLLGFRIEPGGVRVPHAGAFDRADALPHENPGGVEPFEQRRVERMLRADGVGADRLQVGDDAVLVGGAQRVAVAGHVLLDGGAVELAAAGR